MLRRPLTMAAWFFAHEGFARLVDDGPPTVPAGGPISERDLAIAHELGLQAKTFDASPREGEARPESIRQVLAVRAPGSMPLIILTAGKRYSPPPDAEEARILDAFFQYRVYKD